MLRTKQIYIEKTQHCFAATIYSFKKNVCKEYVPFSPFTHMTH